MENTFSHVIFRFLFKVKIFLKYIFLNYFTKKHQNRAPKMCLFLLVTSKIIVTQQMSKQIWKGGEKYILAVFF